MSTKLTAGIVGGGNSAHILVNLCTRNGLDTIVITRRPDEWNTDGVSMRYGNDADVSKRTMYEGGKFVASDDYQLLSTANVIFLCCPVHVQLSLLMQMKPFIHDENTLIGTVFGQARFDKMVKYVFGGKQPCFAFIQIPWICRATKYGEKVDNLGDQNVDIAVSKNVDFAHKNMGWMKYTYTDKSMHANRVSFEHHWFFPSNIVIHPGICYGRHLIDCRDDYFYRNVSPISGACIEQLDAERLKVVHVLNERHKLNVNDHSINQFWTDLWGHKQGANMFQMIRAEATLSSIKVPVDIQYNAQHRFFRDDIPFGLCYIKYVADLLDVKTPFIERVIKWAQTVIGVDYLDEHGRLVKANLPKYYVEDDDPLGIKKGGDHDDDEKEQNGLTVHALDELITTFQRR